MATIRDFKPDPRNANKHSEFGSGLLENSLRFNGAGRSVLSTRDNIIIAGNGVFEGAAAIGIEKVKVVETDGNELIVVKRMDLKSGSPEALNMALADNIVAQKNIVLDTEVVESIAQEFPDETKFWTSIVLEEPNRKGNENQADTVTMKFELSSRQYAVVKKGFKLAKQVYQDKLAEPDNEEEQGNLLFLIMQEFIKNHKNK